MAARKPKSEAEGGEQESGVQGGPTGALDSFKSFLGGLAEVNDFDSACAQLGELGQHAAQARTDLIAAVPDVEKSGIRAAAPQDHKVIEECKDILSEMEAQKKQEVRNLSAPKTAGVKAAIPPQFWPFLFAIARQVLDMLEQTIKSSKVE